MPLVTLCGHPASGKSTRAAELASYFRGLEEKMDVVVINEESLNLKRNDIYKDSMSERRARSSFKAAVERYLAQRVVVIADTLNNIKGIRYELHCRAREIGTPHCLLFCDTEPNVCRQWNVARAEDVRYDEKSFEDLIGRMETPDGKRRWDAPLFVVKSGDPTPLKDIAAQETTDANSLYELDRVTQDVVKSIMDAQKITTAGDVIKIPNCTEGFVLSRGVGLAELRRLRSQFLKLVATRQFNKTDEIAAAFVQYLNANV